jgi:hypothetical protein
MTPFFSQAEMINDVLPSLANKRKGHWFDACQQEDFLEQIDTQTTH